MRAYYLISVWLHILAATIWIGGMIFLSLVVIPITRVEEFQRSAASLTRITGVRFRWLGWGCLALLLFTGLLNLTYRGFDFRSLWTSQFREGPFQQALSIKLFLVVVILLISAFHDFAIGPRATALLQSDPDSAEAKRLRRRASWIGRLNLLLALAVVALAVVMVRGWPG